MRHTSRRQGLALFPVILFQAGLVQAAPQHSIARQVAAPASDIVSGVVRLPDPAATPTVSRAAVLPLRFTRTSGARWTSELELPIERGGAVALALLSPDAGTWQLFVGTEGVALRPIEQAFALERRIQLAGDELPGWVLDRCDLRDAPAGRWSVRVEATGSRSPAEGWLIARTVSDLRIEAHVTTQHLVAGGVFGVVARVRGDDTRASVEQARLVLDLEGRAQELSMLDDGQHEDGALGDGLFGAIVPASLRGQVLARVELAGSTSDGARFLRTAQISFPVLEQRVLLDGSVQASVVDEQHLELAIGALPFGPVQPFHVSAEVWGRDAADHPVPVCWLSRELDPEMRDGAWTLPLVLDTRWLDVAGARTPLELRAVRVQDPDTDVVFDRVDRLPLVITALPPRKSQRAQEITSEMLTGGTSLLLGSASSAGPHTQVSPTLIAPALMLVHGYCSGGSIWPAADFTQPKLEFLDPSANRTHDQFAQLIDQRAQQAGLSSFGVVTHSQGGCAALHLFTYYTSGLDRSTGGRRIQSLAAPYQGTPLASLGSFACGVNNDMTPAGAATWLAGIPTWARAEVYFWTTADAGSACNFFTSLLLADPEDGTVERMRGQLPGGNSMGHVTGWCHTTGMSYPASYTDHARNQAMNAAAAR